MKILFGLLTLLMITSASNADTNVSSGQLQNLLERCGSAHDDQAEVKCLRRGINRMIRGNDYENNSLQCRSNGTNFAIYNTKEQTFVDNYYSKSARECGLAIEEATDKYVCATNSSGAAAIYDYSKSEFVDNYYGGTLDTCIKAIKGIRKNVVCLTSSSSKYARYDLARKEFLDTRYSLNLEECIALTR